MAIKHISEVDKVQPSTMLIMKKDGTSVGEVEPHSLTQDLRIVLCNVKWLKRRVGIKRIIYQVSENFTGRGEERGGNVRRNH